MSQNKHTVWGKIPVYARYIISIDGEVRSVKHNTGQQERQGTLLKGEISNKGYRRVRLYTNEGTNRKESVHRLVLKCFVGLSSLDCDHKDEVKLNNRLENLRYMTRSSNVKRSAHRNSSPGYSDYTYDSTIKMVNLGRKEWLEIREKHRLVKAKKDRKLLRPSIQRLATEYNVTDRQIRSALYGEPRWAK